MPNKLEIQIGQYSNKGRKQINQDFHDTRIPKEPQLTNKGIAIAIADGISSSEVSGEASKVSVTSFLEDYFCTSESWSVKKSASSVLKATNSWLHSKNWKNKYHLDKDRGYVCTFTALILKSNTAHILHIGDSRVYRLREKKLELLTIDHRVWVGEGKSYLSRAMGIDSILNPDYETFEIQKDDIFLLMTDGVYEFLEEEFMKKTFEEEINDFDITAKYLIDTALQNGSGDNLTIQIAKITNVPSKNIEEIHKQLTSRPIPPILEARMDFDGYEILRELSHTSRSHVYLALDKQTEEQVVIKTPSVDLKDDKAYLERFLMEEWISRRINHENVAKAYLQNRKRNYLYNVSEYIPGQTLSQWLIDNPNEKLEVKRKIIKQIAKGLNAFHKQEMVHQDLRTENIMIDNQGTVKIIDFGATKVKGILETNNMLEQENLLGTALYSAPEYFIGKEGTSKSDIFSLGIITYEMLSQEFPYGTNIARCRSKSAQNRLKYKSLYPKFPIWIDESLKKALQVNPEKRYDEVSEFIYDLENPNKKFINKKPVALIQRNPLLFWQSSTLILFLLVIILLFK